MSRSINEVLALREDISDFIVHLTKTDENDPTIRAIDNLANILRIGRIEARNPHGRARTIYVAGDTQKAVCFSETPLHHIGDLSDIAGRQKNLEPYGLVFTKVVARRKGVIPVWYVDVDSDQDAAIDALVKAAIADHENGGFDPTTNPASALFPYIESMGKGTNPFTGKAFRNEWWWEREWRHVGDFDFDRATDVAIVVAPEVWHPWFATNYPALPCIDVTWTAAQMQPALARIDPATRTQL